MNSFKGNISKVTTEGHFSVITIDINTEIFLKSIILETPKTDPFLHKNNAISVLFKETEVIISLDKNSRDSILNRIPGNIKHIEKGVLLTKVKVSTSAGIITAILSTYAVNDLELTVEKKVTCLIKWNEIMLSKI
ncbi:TOBE domain-containing protein [uncultured Maribacter sp.]|uniref:TOBE domain-containing protein n=1 Tax=uncultured Maribacter sp. TaxID=431308 RepID=UPI00261C1581|nr:TOBE domain-containing protein [uncultured Maribacter sp.]